MSINIKLKNAILAFAKKVYIVDANGTFTGSTTFTKYYAMPLVSGKTYKYTLQFDETSVTQINGSLTLETTTGQTSSTKVDTIFSDTNKIISGGKLSNQFTASGACNYLHVVLQGSTLTNSWNIKVEEVM